MPLAKIGLEPGQNLSTKRQLTLFGAPSVEEPEKKKTKKAKPQPPTEEPHGATRGKKRGRELNEPTMGDEATPAKAAKVPAVPDTETIIEDLEDAIHAEPPTAAPGPSASQSSDVGDGMSSLMSTIDFGSELGGGLAIAKLPSAEQNVFPQLPDLTPYCNLCHAVVDPVGKGVRLTKKGPCPEYRCSKCNTKCSQLSTLFGGWPIEQYRKLPEDVKLAFWKDSGSGVHALKEAVEKHIVVNSVKQQFSEFSGKFLPLSVWAGKGYNAKAIETER